MLDDDSRKLSLTRDTASNDDVKLERYIAREEFLACTFILGSDRKRYGKLIENLENHCVMDIDMYPQDAGCDGQPPGALEAAKPEEPHAYGHDHERWNHVCQCRRRRTTRGGPERGSASRAAYLVHRMLQVPRVGPLR
jgi:hypothetical protein